MVVDVTPAACATTRLLEVVRRAGADPPVVVPLLVVPVVPDPPTTAGPAPSAGPGTAPPGAVATAPGWPGTPVGADRPWPFWAPTALGPICTVEPQADSAASTAATATGRSGRTRRMGKVFALHPPTSSSDRPKSTGWPDASGHFL